MAAKVSIILAALLAAFKQSAGDTGAGPRKGEPRPP